MREMVKNFMTEEVIFCTPQTTLQEVARMMIQGDCGCIPVAESKETMKPIGTVTDRDITCRTVAEGKNPLQMTAQDCMTAGCVTVSRDAKLEECLNQMEEHKLRRILVVDDLGKLCGIVAQADIARSAEKKKTGEVVQEVSQPA